MKVAISTDSGYVSQHFGRCPVFTLVECEDEKVIEKKEIPNPGHHPGYLPEFLKKEGV
ncbi:MAG: dinitrogenase iron-molybdenum cofactor, partial [Candidatus Omnitrophica bacterium]|nr:dinitrogenase iron-molybdenum cofactor [Candidatus Omnitrophota bacterium]